MTCPVCGGNTRIDLTRKDCDAVYRRRKCYECEYEFYTVEAEDDSSYDEILRLERERNVKRFTTKR